MSETEDRARAARLWEGLAEEQRSALRAALRALRATGPREATAAAWAALTARERAELILKLWATFHPEDQAEMSAALAAIAEATKDRAPLEPWSDAIAAAVERWQAD